MTDHSSESSIPTFSCPVCHQPVQVGQTNCPNPNCQIDLRPLAVVDTITDSLFMLAQEQTDRHETHKAVQTLESLIAYQPENVEAWVALGAAYDQAGNAAEARRCWQKVIMIRPEEPRAQAALAKWRVAEEAAQKQARRRQVFMSALPVAGLLVIFAVALAIFLRGGSPATPVASDSEQTLAGAASTATPDFKAAISAALQADPELDGLEIQVDQKGLTVALSGELQSQEQKTRLESLVSSLPGLELLDTTRLAMTTPNLAEAVRQKLAGIKDLSGQIVDVKQEGANILLSGKVESQALKILAEKESGSVDGVSLVDSRNLIVAPVSLVEQVLAGLKADPRTACFDISVSQEGDAVQLKGKVYSQQAFDTIELLAHRVKGIPGVDTSQLTIEPPFGEYVVRLNDNLEQVALNVYGDRKNAALIYEANPGKFPLIEGETLAIPPEDAALGGLPVVDCTQK